MESNKAVLFCIYICILITNVAIGILRYKRIDAASKIIICLLFTTLISECLTRIYEKNPVYHFYTVLELFLVTLYFFKQVQLKNGYYIAICGILYVILEIFELIFLHPLHSLNYSYIIFDSFLAITMALFALYKILINESIRKTTKYAHFWFWTLILIYFSSTFLFWPCVKILYAYKSGYYYVVVYSQIIMNIFVYSGTALTLFFYPKMINSES